MAITDVTVLSMVPGAAPLESATVLIAHGRIASIMSPDEAAVPSGYTVIDGSGRYLLPGFTDMHMHFLSEDIPELEVTAEDILAPYIAHGVLQVADLAATDASNAIRDRVESGEAIAPFLATAAMVDGVPAMRDGAREIASPEGAEAVVAQIAAQGFDFVKIYSQLDMDTFRAVLDAAQKHGMRVIGHIPGGRATQPVDVLVPGFAMVAHAEEFSWRAREMSDSEIADIVARLLENDTALTATLFLNEQILAQSRDPDILASVPGLETVHPIELMLWFEMNHYIENTSPERIAQLEAVVDFNARLISAASQAGVTVLAGTDAAFVPGLAPGLSLHRELAAMVEAGMSEMDTLQSATSVPAQWLGVANDRGTVETGKRANLVLLSADPLEDIANTTKIEAVIFDGQILDRVALDAILADLDALYAPYRPWFSPHATELLSD
ncbi:amidohydrolase family protein [Pelagibacterium nitratireducens]|uniref:Amidohydrolase family protein n=1 Tax=Pelagibacterium nitratireducens TaxID=1046114 RepID=A0ABZ2I686_9HYPH